MTMIRYKYRTFAERLGPQNAKSIVIHYITVLGLSYMVWYGDQTKGKSSEDDFNCDICRQELGVEAHLDSHLPAVLCFWNL